MNSNVKRLFSRSAQALAASALLTTLLLGASAAPATPVTTYATGTLAPWPSASPAPINTVDAHYTRVLTPVTTGPGTPAGSGAALVLNPTSTGWIPNSGSSQWITNANPGLPASFTAYYETRFDMSTFITSSASFLGLFACNGTATIALNGVDLMTAGGSYNSCSTTAWGLFSFNGANTPLNSGWNYLTFTVSGGSPATQPNALRVEYGGDAKLMQVPEPTSLALTGLALLCTGLARRRPSAPDLRPL